MTKLSSKNQANVRICAGVANPTPITGPIALKGAILDFTSGEIELSGPDVEGFYQAFKGQRLTLDGNLDKHPVKWFGVLARHERSGGKFYIQDLTSDDLRYTPSYHGPLIVRVNA